MLHPVWPPCPRTEIRFRNLGVPMPSHRGKLGLKNFVIRDDGGSQSLKTRFHKDLISLRVGIGGVILDSHDDLEICHLCRHGKIN